MNMPPGDICVSLTRKDCCRPLWYIEEQSMDTMCFNFLGIIASQIFIIVHFC